LVRELGLSGAVGPELPLCRGLFFYTCFWLSVFGSVHRVTVWGPSPGQVPFPFPFFPLYTPATFFALFFFFSPKRSQRFASTGATPFPFPHPPKLAFFSAGRRAKDSLLPSVFFGSAPLLRKCSASPFCPRLIFLTPLRPCVQPSYVVFRHQRRFLPPLLVFVFPIPLFLVALCLGLFWSGGNSPVFPSLNPVACWFSFPPFFLFPKR